MMRKIESLSYSDTDSQQCLTAINEKLPELGIDENDIISVQYKWNENAIAIEGKREKAHVTIFVFYWSSI